MKVLNTRPNELITRQATAADFDFAWNLYAESVKPLVSNLTKRPWDDTAEKSKFQGIWDSENSHIVLFDGVPIGWFGLSGDDKAIRIDHGYIAKSHQGKGIGSILVDFVTRAGAKTERKVIAETLINGSADRFLEKVGFTKTSTTEITKQMEWKA